MYRNHGVSAVAVVIIMLFTCLYALEQDDNDKTLSPYFIVNGDDNGNFPLMSTNADVHIAGVIADVAVTQVYKNESKEPIEAIYLFPASTRAAVYALRMMLNGRTIDAKVKERTQARTDYENARQQGKSASLLEQQRPNVFQMNVANIMPGDTIKVELWYTELLVPVDNTYEFVYPTVVGPRYSNSISDDIRQSEHEQWVQNPYLEQGKKPAYSFDIHIGVHAGMPIREMASPSHNVTIQYKNQASASAILDRSESTGGNRDFILRYQLAGNAIESGMILYEGEKENFFCMMVQPPRRVTLQDIPQREYIFVVDVSGSMNGFPLDISKELLRNLISNLRPSDRFNVVLFAGASNLMSSTSLPATEENIGKAIQMIGQQRGGGGTNLLPALERSLKLPRIEAVSRSIVVVTDGYVNVETQAFDLIRNNLNKANLFAFGIGSSVNRMLVEGMARIGGGEPFVIIHPDNASETAEKFRTYINNPVLTQVKYSFDGFSVYDVEPVTIPDIMASRPVIVYGKWKGKPSGTAKISGFTGRKELYEKVFNVKKINPSENNSALRYLWARNRIAQLSDYNTLQLDDDRVKEVTSIGLNYNLLTAYTSFVAIDSEIRNISGNTKTIKQPLPLPRGVSKYAVGSPVLSGQMRKSMMPVKQKQHMALPKSRSYRNNLTLKSSLEETSMADLKYEQDKKDNTTEGIQFSNPASIVLKGKTILYFWKSTITDSKSEIAAMIKFAQKIPDINIIIINNDTKDPGMIKRILMSIQLMSIKVKTSVPSNVSFVHDSQNALLKHTDGITVSASKPIILFMHNRTVVNSRNGHLSYWDNSEKVLALFK